jgi:membrane protein implicated in regulation of membrane protease activity
MLILFSAVLFFGGLMLLGTGIAVWLIGLAIRLCLLLVQGVILIVLGGAAVYEWMQRRPKVLGTDEVVAPLIHLVGPMVDDVANDNER